MSIKANAHGKREGARIIYFWATSEERIFILYAYPKKNMSDLSKDQLSTLKNIVHADFKMKDEHFNKLITSIEEAGKIKCGEIKAEKITEFSEPDVNAIRENVGSSQSKFAALIGVNLRTLQNWEQGHRHPTGPARTLLKLS